MVVVRGLAPELFTCQENVALFLGFAAHMAERVGLQGGGKFLGSCLLLVAWRLTDIQRVHVKDLQGANGLRASPYTCDYWVGQLFRTHSATDILSAIPH